MPNTVELLTPDQLSTLVGKSFSVEVLGGGKAAITPLTPATGSKIVPAKVMLKGVEVEGLQAAKAAAAQQVGASQTGAGAQTLVPAKIPVVEIEGAGKTVGAGKSMKVLSLETRGTMKVGSKGAMDLIGGEAKIAPAAKAAPVGATPVKATPAAPQTAAKAQTVALTQPATDTAGGAATQGVAIGSSLVKGSGLGLSLSFWGPMLLAGVATAAVGVGVYNYLKRKQQNANA
ncbi:MAG: hypothetical protein HQL64_11825 [Magnetococcales bacterium]|nr:hypothetical protein [Magnetococcales bacterium]